MLTLIKKDFQFSIKYVLISALFCAAAPLLLILDGDNLYHLLSFYIPMVSLGVILGKICYLEDSDEVKIFLKSMPYKRKTIILSKYVELLILTMISFIYVCSVQMFISNSYDFNTIFKLNSLISVFFIVYYSIYLYMYFSKNYYYAQNTMYIILAIVFIAIFLINRNMIAIETVNEFLNSGMVYAAIGISVISLLCSIFFSFRSRY